ncbi:MAG TPA: hypothetical protein VJN96_09115 [Vicinamibacterales bacterium]|nr:hypothetical protein [Vicinamibacterales bacterium]
MANRSKTRKAAAAVVDGNLLYARAKAKQVRAHAALEREIARMANRLETLILKRNASLQRLAEFITAEIGPFGPARGRDVAVSE